jgi:hypothetical protein
MNRAKLLLLFICFAPILHSQTIPVPTLANDTEKLASLIGPSLVPFHLKAVLYEGVNKQPQGEMVIDQVSKDKWRQIITTPNFKETKIANNGRFYQNDEGDYFPTYVRNLSNAAIRPIYDELLTALRSSKVKLKFYKGLNKLNICDGMTIPLGNEKAKTEYNVSVCFAGDPPLLSSYRMLGNELYFSNKEPFEGLQVYRLIQTDMKGDAGWRLEITELSKLNMTDESIFNIPENSAAGVKIKLYQLSEKEVRSLFTEIPYEITMRPSDMAGESKHDVINLYVSIDRHGVIREVWPLRTPSEAATQAATAFLMNKEIRHLPENKYTQLETTLTFELAEK